jgi:tape measure domain-containing protein
MDQVIAFMEQVNKQFVIGGATAQEQSNAMIQLTQAMAAGALRGEELNSILDGAPGIARAIEKYMGIAEGSIKTVAQEGKVTAEVVKNAMFAMADETNAKFDSMPKTWAQIWVDMKNQALSMFAPILTNQPNWKQHQVPESDHRPDQWPCRCCECGFFGAGYSDCHCFCVRG